MKGFISEEALAEYSRLAAEKLGTDFAEGEVYDFGRCMRPDGSFYGTRGKCKKGTEAGDAPAKEKSNKSGGGNIPLLTNEDIAKKSTKELVQIKKQMDERAFGKGSKPVSNEVLQGMSDQNKRINEELKKRVKGGGDAPTPRATVNELRDKQRALFDDAKAKRAAAKEAEKAAKAVAKETKGDNSPEAKKRRLEAGRAWDKAGTAADRAQRGWEKAHEKWSKASEREKRAQMSPEQRKEARNIDRIIKERG
jgi:hypothetical protein